MVSVQFYQYWGKDTRVFECVMQTVPRVGEYVFMGEVRGRIEDVEWSCEAPMLPVHARIKVTGFTKGFGKD